MPGVPYWLAFPLAMAVSAGVSALIEVGVVRRLRGRPGVTGMKNTTLGLSQFVLILALLVSSQGLNGLTFPKPPGLPSFTLGRTPIGPAFTAMALLAPLLLGGLALFLRRSRFGLAVRAGADAPDTAQLNGIPAARMTTLAWALLFGLAGYAERPVGELSTGTRRTVELACLLALEPSLLLLDEPSSGVSQDDGVALADLLSRVNRELGVALLVIEHDLPLLSRLAGRMVAMDAGRVIADGTPDQVRAHPAVVAAYLGTEAAAVHRSGAPV